MTDEEITIVIPELVNQSGHGGGEQTSPRFSK